MKEKLLVFNGYGGPNQKGSALARWVKRLDPDVAIVSELGRLDDNLNKVGRVYSNRGDDPKDVGIVVRGSLTKFASWSGRQLTRFVYRGGSKPKLWRDRWVVRVRVWKRVYYSVHGNAVISSNGHWLNNEGARVWREAMSELKEDLRQDMNKGLRVRIGGDFKNFKESDVGLSPNSMFESLGLHYIDDNGVMFLAWDPRKDVVLKKDVLGKAPGADHHRALLVVLDKKPRR